MKNKEPAPETNKRHKQLVTERFMIACRYLVSRRDRIKNFTQLAERLLIHKSAFTQLNAPGYDRGVTIPALVRLCEVFHISGEWLLTGKGTMWGDAQVEKRLEDIENRVDLLEETLLPKNGHKANDLGKPLGKKSGTESLKNKK